MTVLSWIQSHGVSVSLVGPENILLDGLDRLNEDQAAKVVEFAKQNKPRLLVELRGHVVGEPDPLAGAMCKHCVHHSVTCICSGPCTARGLVRDPECVACHAFVEKQPGKRRQPAYYSGYGWEGILQ